MAIQKTKLPKKTLKHKKERNSKAIKKIKKMKPKLLKHKMAKTNQTMILKPKRNLPKTRNLDIFIIVMVWNPATWFNTLLLQLRWALAPNKLITKLNMALDQKCLIRMVVFLTKVKHISKKLLTTWSKLFNGISYYTKKDVEIGPLV